MSLAGTNGITLSGNGADLSFTGTGLSTITTAASQNFAINPGLGGLIGINTAALTPLSSLDIRPNLASGGTISVASVSGKTSFAAMVVDQSGTGDIFTASAAGLPLFTIQRSGSLVMSGYKASINFTGTGPNSITTAASQNFAINPGLGGLIGINTAALTPLSSLDIRPLWPVAEPFRWLRFPALPLLFLVVDQSGLGDIFTASAAGLPLFTIQRNGNIVDSLAKSVNFSNAALTVASCTGCATAGTNWWNLVNGNGVTGGGYITPINSTADLLIGGQSTASATFAVLGLQPTVSVASVGIKPPLLFRGTLL